MTAIWHHDDEGGWRLLPPSSFPDEANLHDLVEEAPHLLPLAGSPRLVVLGREVRLGSGFADLIAVERSGRPVVIEIKLARNAEARRAVVAQVLAYAAYLYGLSTEDLERDVLPGHLRQRGFGRIAEAVAADDQSGSTDQVAFEDAFDAHLRTGRFRLVIVLDSAPEELVRLVGYLEAVTPELLIDLVTVSQYQVGGSMVLVPQRVDPERLQVEATPALAQSTVDTGFSTSGVDDFAAAAETAPEEQRPDFRKVVDWAKSLEENRLARVLTYHGKRGMPTLLVRLMTEDVGLVVPWMDQQGVALQLFRSVFERACPDSIEAIEALLGRELGQGTGTRDITDELLEALTESYRRAAAA